MNLKLFISKNIFQILFIFLLIAALIVRLLRFDHPLLAGSGESNRDYLVASHILNYREYPLVGPWTNTFLYLKQSPLYFYLVAFFLLFSKNYLFLGYVNIALQILNIILLYFIAEKLFNAKTAFFAMLLFSFSEEILRQSEYFFQPFVMQPFLTLSYLLLIDSYLKRSYRLLLVSVFVLLTAAAIYGPAYLAAPIFILTVFFILKNQGRKIISNPLKELTKEQVAEVEGLPSARRSGDIRRQSSTDGKETSDRIWKTAGIFLTMIGSFIIFHLTQFYYIVKYDINIFGIINFENKELLVGSLSEFVKNFSSNIAILLEIFTLRSSILILLLMLVSLFYFFLYPSAFKLQGFIPNGALIFKKCFNCIINLNSNLKATVGIYHFFAKSKQSGIEKKGLHKKYMALVIAFMLQPLVFTSAINKDQPIFYLMPAFGLLCIVIAGIIIQVSQKNIIFKFLGLILIFFIFKEFSSNFSFIHTKPSYFQNLKLVKSATKALEDEIIYIQSEDHYSRLDFFQIKPYRKKPNSVYDQGIFLASLEKDLGRKFTKVSDEISSSLEQINSPVYIFLECYEFESNSADESCINLFNSEHPNYIVSKIIYDQDPLTIYLSERGK